MSYQFDIRYSGPKRQFEEEVFLQGRFGKKLTPAIMDTGATISIIDLEYALELGAEIVGMSTVVGVSLIPNLIYVVKLSVSVVDNQRKDPPLVYEEARILGAIPHFYKGGNQSIAYMTIKGSENKVAMPLLIFKTGFPGVSLDDVSKILSHLVVKDGKVLIENINLPGIGAPLLIGVDIMEALADKGFPMKFDFKNRYIHFPSISSY